MIEEKEYKLQVIITHGPEDFDRAVLGFAFAASAAASGINLKVILILNAIVWLIDNEPTAQKRANGFNSIYEYMNILTENGTDTYLCSTCVKNFSLTKQSKHNSEIPIIGLTEVAICASEDSIQTVVF